MKYAQSGLSYVEVLVAVLFLSVALVPMMDAFAPGIQGADQHAKKLESHYALAGALETVLAEPFQDLEAAASEVDSYNDETSYSDTNAPVPYYVYIWRYDADDADMDGDPFTGGKEDLLWIKVESIDGLYSLQTLLSSY